MTLLVDTCTLIWLGSGAAQLPERVRLRLTEGVVKVSEISRIEIVIKEQKFGRFGVDFDAVIAMAGFEKAAFPADAHRAYSTLPDHHKDPFDRMLIAHAMIEGLTLVTCDDDIRKYDVQTFW